MTPYLFSNLDALVNFAKARAQRGGIYDGRQSAANMALMAACAHQFVVDPERTASIIYTRDAGHHTSGWWKNPDYERCLHMSIGFLGMPGAVPIDFDKAEAQKLALAFWGDDCRKVWVEGPYSPEGKARDVWHYRLFCDADWRPILPRGEVYSKEHTPTVWKSFSEIHGWSPKQDQAPFLTAGGDKP